MPFSRYLDQSPSDSPTYAHPSASHSDAALGLDPSTFSSNVQFQVPNLIFGAPTIAPGGGAEVLPPGFISTHGPLTASCPSTSSAPPKYHLPCPDNPYPTYPSPQLPVPPGYRHPYGTPTPSPPTSLSLPTALGLPVYSTSGFDLLSILARVANRPHPKIVLGPVDLTCSFVVSDVRRYDSPIVYASPTFCRLTGYDEHEILGRNCRFLQSPDGRVQRGEQRRHTAPEAVLHLKRCTSQDKECQTSMINYRKGGAAFINLVTVIPILGGVNGALDEADEVVYHVGFQVDLTEQPSAILQKLRDGSYLVDYSRKLNLPTLSGHSTSTRDWRAASSGGAGVSPELHALLENPALVDSLPISTGTMGSATPAVGEKPDPLDGNRLLSLVLLEHAPDFVHVVSLKGAFLYVAPSVRRVLGYEPEELVGRSIAEFCHPADVVPLMRELKESSGPITSGHALSIGASSTTPTGGTENIPRKVDLLFRMPTKAGTFVWVECRGRLHVEPGKGRKAIILSGRVRHMPRLDWGPIERSGGLSAPVVAHTDNAEEEHVELEREFWGVLSTDGTFLFVGAAVRDVLGWGAGEVIGRTLRDLIGGAAPAEAQRVVEEELARVCAEGPGVGMDARTVSCEMKRRDGTQVSVQVVLYRSQDGTEPLQWTTSQASASANAIPDANQGPVVCQVKLYGSGGRSRSGLVHHVGDSVFDELQTARGSSWQYELQQVKFANQRLVDEVAALEAAIAAKARQPSTPQLHLPSMHQVVSPYAPAHEYAESQMPSYPPQRVDAHPSQDWRMHGHLSSWSDLQTAMPMMPMKRSWEGVGDPGGPT
ncbi:uncharacterized protein LAESUDRAFT_665406 [Laetiporus sulphureus 93-53]|uniref:PAS domain-containing protein n=1 Tax=Laetiporus sulphureus 93-53 TaxID=1314785 RepID=A0A165BCL7_9APHY|nr:uncharacterized protein LAESUDRAFT_665406 [Laetiporus sulphureus 93-53]KZT00746.1 hypothetical protein LAESUDRAFT_665406 [Laetiporus sulphureus 93-53]